MLEFRIATYVLLASWWFRIASSLTPASSIWTAVALSLVPPVLFFTEVDRPEWKGSQK